MRGIRKAAPAPYEMDQQAGWEGLRMRAAAAVGVRRGCAPA